MREPDVQKCRAISDFRVLGLHFFVLMIYIFATINHSNQQSAPVM